MGMVPLVAAIRRHSLEDGPGIRSVVFFKGCPLRCVFCQNPETQEAGAEIAFAEGECIRWGACLAACPAGAVDFAFPARIRRERCTLCGRCAEACPGRGLRLIGRHHRPEALAEILLRDRAFYRHSGGGVTLSGGECTLHPGYLARLLVLLKEAGVHVALQTCGFFDYAVFREKILPFLDLVHYDLKLADPELHRRYTGRSNRRIIGNLRRLLREERVAVEPRIPLVPEITATRENLAALVELLRELRAGQVTLLPYNPMGIAAALSLGRPAPPVPATFTAPREEEELVAWFRSLLSAAPGKTGETPHHPPHAQEVHP